MALLMQHSNVQVSIAKSLDGAPKILVPHNENNSPLKWKLHIENNKVVPACTYGYGTIYGKVVDDWNNPVCNAVAVSYTHL